MREYEERLSVSITKAKSLICLLVACGIVVQVGCNQRSTYQVSGKVRYKDGSPITGGARVINFEPTQSTTAKIRKPATSQIAEDGSFQMYTRKPGDGVIPGKYAVVFVIMDKPLGGKMLVQEKYTKEVETPYEINVDGDKTGLEYEIEKQ
jgi:hypothetical protein